MGKINYPRNKRRLEFGCRGPRLCAETMDDEEKIKLGRERRHERDADNKEVRFIKKYGFKAYWDHYKPLLNEFNHYCLPEHEIKKSTRKYLYKGIAVIYYRTEGRRHGLDFRSLLMGCGAVARQRLGLRVLRSASLHWSSSTLEQLEDRWSEEKGKGMAWACPDWEVERKGVQLRDHDKPEYTPSEGKGGQLRDRNKPEYTPAVEIGTHLCCVTTMCACLTVQGSGRQKEVGAGHEVVDAREAIEEDTQDARVQTAWRVRIGGKHKTHSPGAQEGAWWRSGFVKHDLLAWIIFTCSVSFDSVFACSSVILAKDKKPVHCTDVLGAGNEREDGGRARDGT
ncbi:hypothetical protein C8F04DRAFT_1199233 [Mycena alexandri]|uniref:Uncharacterized protein n=1 Tax=Mycena alexandri TaxID=1745969 RepID=A0AAD6WNS5_9AGAR|nr:hypothetical protein C8F04DRAFT_1199233 [Mycena alexandri]